MSVFFLGLGIFAICMIAIALVLLFKGDGSSEQKLMQYFLIGSLIQNAGYLLELMAPGLDAAIVAVKVQYMGSLVVPISYCYFMFNYCYQKKPAIILNFLTIVDIFILGLVFTCDIHNLYYRQINWLVTEEGHGYLSLDYGPGYWVFLLCGTVVPYALSIYVLIRACVKYPQYAAERKYRLILALSFLPVVALGSYSMKLTYIYDPTPFTLGTILSIVVILIWSRKVYDFSGLAAGILLNSMGDGVIALDEQRRIISFNPAATRIFPELGNHMKGKNIGELKGFPQDMLEKRAKEEFCLNSSFYQGHVEQIPDKSGRNKGYVVLILDVTETRNYIEEIKRVREQAEQANIAKSAFLANMSHEIRTPMNAIVGLSDVIMEESRGRKVYEYACDIKSSSGNLLTLINDILDLSKVEAGKMELVMTKYHVKALVNEVLNMLDIVASQHGLRMQSEFDMSIPCRYLGDEGRIKQILINILNNALKFTKEGFVGISVSGEPGDTEDKECLIFRIEDSGCGIREEDIEGIFENFRQVDSRRNRSVEGTGLGLSITKRLVELMQGTIEVESVYGEGTVFTVKIPQEIVDKRLLSEVPEEEVKREEKLEPFVAEEIKILLVDDNVINRRVARILLQSYGMEIEEADCGQEAINLVRRKRYDIIFMDHMMPVMDGIEAVEIIRRDCGENGTKPTIVALTANAMEGMRERFLDCGFQDFIPKPLEKKALNQLLMRWIPENRRMSIDTANTSPPLNPESFQIEGIDLNVAIEYFSGSEAGFVDLLELYYTDGKRKIGLLQGLSQSDLLRYQVEVHGLKSASANIGAMDVSALARSQENAAAQGDTELIAKTLPHLLTEYEKLLDNIGRFLKQHQTDIPQGQKLSCPPPEELQMQAESALHLLEDFQSKECEQAVEAMLLYDLPKDTEDSLRQIQTHLKLFEDDEAEELLRLLSDRLGKEKS